MNIIPFRKRLATWVFGAIAIAIMAGACAQAAGGQQASANDQQVAELKKQLSAKDQENAQLKSEISASKSQMSAVEKDAKYWKQLTSLMKPAEMKNMADHRVYMLPTGAIIGLHFDNLDLSKAENLNWVAFGVPGKFTKAEQERVEKQFGKGFTHFHDMKNDVHGGQPGAEGAWFVHMAVRDFESPMSGGQVKAGGIDNKFMPTAATQ